jgi:hypothetical protein
LIVICTGLKINLSVAYSFRLPTFIHSTPLWYRLYFHTYFHLHYVSSIFTVHPLSASPPLRTVTASHVWHRKVRTWIMWRPNYNISEIMEIFRGPILQILIVHISITNLMHNSCII